MKWRVLDLFSGIGGFSYGLEKTGFFETAAFCEIETRNQRTLTRHWPQVPIFTDIRSLRGINLGRIDVVCGGFPCQPFSTASAGKRRGTDDDRFLWPEMLRVIHYYQPSWVLGENVAGIDGLALGQVVSDLAHAGYEVAPPIQIPACAVGQDHRRDRFWFLAYSDQNRQHGRTVNAEAQVLPWAEYATRRLGAQNGISTRLDGDRPRLEQLGNSIVTGIAEQFGRAIQLGWMLS